MTRTSYPTAVLLVVLVAVNLTLVSSALAASADLGPFNQGWRGGTDLQSRAEASGADARPVLTTTPYEGESSAETTAFVLQPSDPYEGQDLDRLREFLRGGGRLVVASDDPQTNALLEHLGASARLNGTTLRDELRHYNAPALPVAGNVSTHPLVADVRELTLNRGTAVEPNGARVLASTADLAYLDVDGDGELDEGDPLGSWPVVTVEPVGEGTLVVVGDQSIFTNAMLRREGNGQFLVNLVAGANRVLVDYSHRDPLPPLAYALVTLRNSSLHQFVVGASALLAVLAWSRRSGEDDETDRLVPRVGLDESELQAFVRERHPEWEESTYDRVTKAIIARRTEDETNE